jgi:hypothetical protein
MAPTDIEPIPPPVMILTEDGPTPVGYEEVMDADYSGDLYPEAWAGDKEMALTRFDDLIHKGEIVLPPEWADRPIRDQFDDYLRDNPDFSLTPVLARSEEPEDTGDTEDTEDTEDTGDTGLYTSPSEALSRNPDLQDKIRAAKKALELEYVDRKAGSEGWGEIAKQVMGGKPFESGSVPISEIFKQAREGAARSAMETEVNRNKAMTATLGALAPEKASEVPRATRMRESKRDVREDEEKQ